MSFCAGHYEFSLSSRVHRQFVTRLRDVAHSEDPAANNWINIVHDKYTETVKVRRSLSAYRAPAGCAWQLPCIQIVPQDQRRSHRTQPRANTSNCYWQTPASHHKHVLKQTPV